MKTLTVVFAVIISLAMSSTAVAGPGSEEPLFIAKGKDSDMWKVGSRQGPKHRPRGGLRQCVPGWETDGYHNTETGWVITWHETWLCHGQHARARRSR